MMTKILWKNFAKCLVKLIKSVYNEYNSSRYLISAIIKMWTATLFAKYKFIGEKMWTATLLARYKYAGEKMISIVKNKVYFIDLIFYEKTKIFSNSIIDFFNFEIYNRYVA